jgi:hypothetical protein
MSDIRCVVCGEPWDAWGANHGDMLPWELKLFRQGAGCPSCEGTPNGYAPATLDDVENGDDDPMLRIIAAERVARGDAPKWERPADPIHWTCDGCGVQVITNLDSCSQDGRETRTDDALEYSIPYKSRAHDWYHSHNPRNGCPETEPAHTFENGTKVCEFCLTRCTECDAPLCSTIEYGDTYDEGNPLPSPEDSNESVCVDCLDKVESREADRVWADCMRPKERIAYMRQHASQFDCLHIPEAESREHALDRWRDILANARGRYFSGYASELLY